MPMMSKGEPVFSFDFKLFKEFINPVNTDNFKISYTEKNRAYIINQEFFKYEEKSKKTKKAEKIIAPKIISKIEKKQEIKEVEKEENDLEYLNNLLSVSQDLLDLISDSGEKEDVDFLKEKIKVTKDLISLLSENYANGGGVSYPDLSKQTAQVVNDSVVLDEFSIKKNKNNFTINGFNKKIMSSDDAVKILREIWEDDTINAYEQAYILYFNKANSLIGYYHHSNGGIDGTVMDIQMICGLAVKSLAKGVIIAHNHPSENTQPSNADKQVSEQLKTALKTFNITLLDSMILTNDSYFSFADRGIL
jgi:DNA repair protein RadC